MLDNYFTLGLLKKPEISHFRWENKEILKNFPKYKSIVYNKLLIDVKLFSKSNSRLLGYIFLFLTELHFALSLLLFFLPNLSFDVLIKCVLRKKECILFVFIKFLFKSLNVFNLLAATKSLITNYSFLVNSFIRQSTYHIKLVHSFAEKINGLVFLWQRPPSWKS